MNRKNLFIVFFTWSLAIGVYGQQAESLFDDVLIDNYYKVISLNESRNYLEAYREIMSVDREMDDLLHEKVTDIANLDDYEFQGVYWPIKKSRAEIAYMLGNHLDMEKVSIELTESLSKITRKTDREPESKAVLEGMMADVAKIDGCRYYLTEKYDFAESALKRALSLKPFDNVFVCRVYDDLAQLYYKQELYGLALVYIDSILSNPLYKDNSRYNVPEQDVMEVRSQRAICLARLARYAEALNQIEPVVNYFRKAGNKRSYAESLRKKAKILMLQYDCTGVYNTVAKTCYQDYLSISKDYIDKYFVSMNESEREQYWMAEQPFVTDCFRLEDNAPELLYDVALYSKAVLLQMGRSFKDGMTESERKNALASIRVTWKQVKEKLPQSSCAIEFVIYEKQSDKHIGALVIDKKTVRPIFIDMASVNAISDYTLADNYKVKDVFADTQDKNGINALYNDTILRSLCWNKELVEAIGDNRNIYFSPDGIFHQMGIEYMIPQSLENKNFYRLTTTRELIQPNYKIHTDRMLVCGDMEYGLSVEDNEPGNDELAYSLLADMRLSMNPLPNSSTEIDSIRAIRKNHSKDMVLRADSVTEKALTMLLGKYDIVHISTHGFFSEASNIGTEIRPSSTDIQLSKSCLFLSGSEKHLKQTSFDSSLHDGILSARELAKTDMDNVDLAVMSACMSGLGFITPDGVFGLQRGLKTAGAKSILLTLWSVDDEATCYFIVQLYKKLEIGLSMHEAFNMARETMKEYNNNDQSDQSDIGGANNSYTQRRRMTVPRFDEPYYYNAFILIDSTF